MQRPEIRVGLFCNARDEKNIREWAAHHILIGFDNIIIFDHKSVTPLSSVFANFDKRVKTIRVNEKVENIKNIKNYLMNIAITYAKKLHFDWFIYLDADEFIILNNKFKCIKDFLNYYALYADSIGINWLMFGTNYHVNDPSNGLIIENYTKSDNILNKHVKSFVKTKKVINSPNPHFYKMKNPYRMLGINNKLIKSPYCFNDVNISYKNVPAYIAHYVYQSEETYIKRKVKLVGDDGLKRENYGKKIHEAYNGFENTDPQKYVKQIKGFLSMYK